jgi:hypothetical protein
MQRMAAAAREAGYYGESIFRRLRSVAATLRAGSGYGPPAKA